MDSTVNLGRSPSVGQRLARRALWSGLVAACLSGCAAPPRGTGDPGARIQFAAIEGSRLVTLSGNTHPAAGPSSLGPVDDGLLIEHMQLVLQRSPEQEAALEAHIDALHDPASPLYQQWLTVEQLADQYNVSPVDVATIAGWLASYGLTVESVPPSRMFIEFSGTAAQVSAAFNTQIHRVVVDGATHFANASDPQIPAELAKVVAGVHALHDFMPHPMRKDVGAVKRDGATGSWRVTAPGPDYTMGTYGTQCFTNKDCTSGTCDTATGLCQCTTAAQCPATLSGAAASCDAASKTCIQCQSNADCLGPSTCNTTTKACEVTFQAVTPADFATIYNLAPLFAEGITGKGQTIAVLEDTLIQNASDVATFRTAFGLGAPYTGTFTQGTVTGTTTCGNPGVNAAESEAALDAEWASASAPDATIRLAACADTTVFGGLIALQNLINGNSPPNIVSISYGLCESQNGNAANKNFVNTYQQAAALGVSVFVSAGDQGAAGCDDNKAVATHGIAVSGYASTPYNVAVGGTDFADYVLGQSGGPGVGAYWSTTNTGTFGSALSYVPEIPWNNSCASSLIYSTPSVSLGTYTEAYGATGFCNSTVGKEFRTTGAGSGGPSTYSAQPTWQTGVVGLPAKSGGMRGLPDVSLFAANGVFGHFLLFCLTDAAQGGGPCTYANTADAVAMAAGGTSFASPAMAGIQALVNQKMGGSQGNPNYTYYKLAAAEQGIKGSTRCNSTGGTAASPALPQPECVFNDVTLGDMDVNCTGTDCFGAAGTAQGALSSSANGFSPAFAAGTGWDYATGLGTVNAYNLVHAWSK
jgi:subtilase family serine protease